MCRTFIRFFAEMNSSRTYSKFSYKMLGLFEDILIKIVRTLPNTIGQVINVLVSLFRFLVASDSVIFL